MTVSVHETRGGNPHTAFLVIDEPFYGIRMIAFRGTTDIADYIIALGIPKFFVDGRVHKGFYDRAFSTLEVVKAIKDGLREGKHVVVTGHSLGGAVAALVTMRMLVTEELGADEQNRLICITFGQPHVGNKGFASFVSKSYNDHFFSYVHKNDVVPRLMMLVGKAKEEFMKAPKSLKNRLLKFLLTNGAKLAAKVAPKVAAMSPVAGFIPIEYESFGTYLFLNDTDLITYNTQDPTRRSDLMMKMKHIEDVEERVQLEHHRVYQYGAFMELLLRKAKAKIVQETRLRKAKAKIVQETRRLEKEL